MKNIIALFLLLVSIVANAASVTVVDCGTAVLEQNFDVYTGGIRISAASITTDTGIDGCLLAFVTPWTDKPSCTFTVENYPTSPYATGDMDVSTTGLYFSTTTGPLFSGFSRLSWICLGVGDPPKKKR